MGAGESDAERDLRYARALYTSLVEDASYAKPNRALLEEWLSAWVPRCTEAARQLQPVWSQPPEKPIRFEDSLERSAARCAEILGELGLDLRKEWIS
jgi:propane monooxygenase small subunit